MARFDIGRRSFVTSSAVGFAGVVAGCSSAADLPASAGDGSTGGGRETDGQAFVQFLKDCSPEERVSLAQSLQMYPTLERTDFGQFGLRPHGDFADDPKSANEDRPVRPQSFNELPPIVVLEAASAGRIDSELATPYRIINALLRTCRNKISALGSDRDRVNYHEIVKWVASKKGVDPVVLESASTFDLEKAVVKQSLATIWDRLTVEQRHQILSKIEQQTSTAIEDKAAVAAMGGAQAATALGNTRAMEGLGFYTTMGVVVGTAAVMLGFGIPAGATVGAAATAGVLSGPVGWLILGAAVVGTVAAYTLLPDSEKTASFVITMNFIKANRLQVRQQQP
jgi:uncharacterized protein YaaW (UPF0174 family)